MAAGRVEISLQSRIAASAEQVSCRVEDETVILSLRTGEYYGLNPVAACIWELLQEERSVSELRDALLGMYDVDEATCTEQTLAVLRDMQDMELLEVVQPA
jgi:hypothetical protein